MPDCPQDGVRSKVSVKLDLGLSARDIHQIGDPQHRS